MSTISTGTAGVRLGMIVAGAIAAAAGLSAQSAARVSAQSEVVATVGGTAITLAQADANALMQSATRFGDVRLAQALYEARKLAINQIVDGELLGREAKVRGIDRNALVQQEITAKVVPVTEADVQDVVPGESGESPGRDARTGARADSVSAGSGTHCRSSHGIRQPAESQNGRPDPPRSAAATPRHEREPDEGDAGRADRAGRIHRFRVSVLRARGIGSETGARRIRGSHPPRLSRVSIAHPFECPAGRRSGRVRVGAGQVLAVS
jgi:hypothetical protein